MLCRPGARPEGGSAGPAEQVTLAELGSDLPERGKLLGSLDALRDHLEVERARQVDDRSPVGAGAQTSPSPFTASRSSFSSFTVRSIRSREKSGTSRPSTISHSPSRVRHGNEEMIPSSTP